MRHENSTRNHKIENWTVANAAARLALTVVVADQGKIAYQQDTQKYYRLEDDSPMTWIELAGTGGGGGGGAFTFEYVFNDTNVAIGDTNKVSIDSGGVWIGLNSINIHDYLSGGVKYLGTYFPAQAVGNFIKITRTSDGGYGLAKIDSVVDHTGYTTFNVTEIDSTDFFELIDGDAVTVEINGPAA